MSKKVISILTVIIVLIMALIGTFAWTDFSQHATNMFNARSVVQVRLNDEFTPPVGWNPMDPAVDKKVSVTNQSASDTMSYVRVQFKEFLETYTLEYSPITDGTDVVLFATYASGSKIGEFIKESDAEAANILDDFDYIPYQVTYPANYSDPDLAGETITYFRTQNSEIKNGIYGKMMDDPMQPPVQTPVKKFGDSEKADYTTPNSWPHELQSASNTECLYEVHEWMNCGIEAPDGDAIHNYITWNLGTQTVLMADWISGGRPLGDFWVLDSDGWAYWANPLAPGATTANILESVDLLKMPGQAFEYYIHIELEAVTADELLEAFYNGGNKGTTGALDLVNKLLDPTASVYKINTYDATGAAAAGVAVGSPDGTATVTTIGTNGTFIETDIIVGLDGIAGTADDNAIVNPAGKVLRTGVEVSRNTSGVPFVRLGNSTDNLDLYPGPDGILGTKDNLVKDFGSFAQNTAAFATKEALNWRLLDIDDVTDSANPTAVLLTDTVISNVKFNTSTADGNTWSTSNLRKWLNSTTGFVSGKTDDTVGFYNAAFSATQKALIADTSVSMASETFRTYVDAAPVGVTVVPAYTAAGFYDMTTTAQASTVDKVWALSAEEVWKYFGKSTVANETNVAPQDPANYTNGIAKGNTYAWSSTNGAASYRAGAGDWADNSYYWLRSPGQDSSRASFVHYGGNVYSATGVTSSNIGARPAITVKIQP